MRGFRVLGGVLVLALAGSAAPSQASAQVYLWGLEAGATYSGVGGETLRDESSVWGPFLGASFEYAHTELLSFPIGVSFHQRGGAASTLPGEAFEISTSYLEFAPLLNLTVPYGRTQRLGIYFGLGVGFLLGCDVSADGTTSDCGDTEVFNTDPATVQLTIPFGVEYDWLTEGGNIFGFDIRYSYGVTQLYQSRDTDIRERGWQFLLSWARPIGDGLEGR
jgi:hypothetical protein